MAYKFNPFTGKLEEYGPILTGTGTVAAAADGTAALPGISFANDLSVGIYRPGAEQLAFSTNGTGRLFIDASGNVGVGTASPRQALTFGSLTSSSTSTPDCIDLGATYTSTSASTNLKFKLYVDSSGNTYGFTVNGSSHLEYYAGTVSSPGNHVFLTGGTERLRITSAGLVGIGTGAPTENLTIYGTSSRFAVTGGAGSSAILIGNQNGSGANNPSVIEAANGSLYFGGGNSWSGGGTFDYTMTLTNDNKVGIGTTSPGYTLDVAGSARIKTGATGTPFVVSTGGDSQGSLRFGSSGFLYGIYGGPDYLSLQFHADGAERARIDSSGRVGIGTTSPGYALHVSGTGAVSSRTFATDATGDASFFAQNDGNGICGPLVYGSTKTAYGALASNETAFYSNRSTTIMADGGSTVIKFATGGNTERARIDSSGRLLVGTSSGRNAGTVYQHRLQIETTQYAGLSIVNNTADTGPALLVLAKSRGTSIGSANLVQTNDVLGSLTFAGADGTDIETPGASIEAYVDGTPGANDMPGRLVFSTTADGASSPTERVRISSVGQLLAYGNSSVVEARTNTGAGTAAWLFYGAYSATGNSDGTQSFGVYTNGNVVNTNNSYGAISDLKLKENIVDANSQWDDIKALQVRNYNFKEGQTHTQIGLVAQEVELVSPGLVTESPDRDEEGNDLGTTTKSVNYSVLYMKAVKALQEAMERIETLEAKVAALEGA